MRPAATLTSGPPAPTTDIAAPGSLSGLWGQSNEITAIIPAAGRVKEGVLPMSGRLNSAMLPVAGKPVIYWTMKYLQRLGIGRFVIGLRERGEFLEAFVQSSFPQLDSLQWVVPDHDGGLAYTVLCCARLVETKRALVVLGDTFFSFLREWELPTKLHSNGVPLAERVPAASFVLAAPVEESDRWCMVEEADGKAVRFIDKPRECDPGMKALIGVYGFDDVSFLRRCLQGVCREVRGRPRRIHELSSVLARYARSSPIEVRSPGEWMDCGNADNLAASHKRLLQKRAFNEVSIDSKLGVFTKRSQASGKFIDEINYYKLLPPRIAVLFPRLVESSIEPGKEFLSLEYYGYPTLAEIWLYENLHPRLWAYVLQHLHDLLVGPMAEYRSSGTLGSFRRMYIDKTVERLESIAADTPVGLVMRDRAGVIVNGRSCPPLHEVLVEVERRLERFRGDGRHTIIHGDLCFSNVLYDLRSRICKFIDPRGSFGDAGIFGDQKYDVAKLYHSVHGSYDFIVNDLFSVAMDGRRLQLEVHEREAHREIVGIFDEIFFRDFDRDSVLLITALLFMSMPPLHYDSPRRQLAMAARGFLLLSEVWG